MRRRLLCSTRFFVEELVDTEKCLKHGHRRFLVLVHLAVVSRIVLKCFTSTNYLQVGFRQTFFLVVFQQFFELSHVLQDLPP